MSQAGWAIGSTLRSSRFDPMRFTKRRARNARLQPIDPTGRVVLQNVRVAGRALAGASR